MALLGVSDFVLNLDAVPYRTDAAGRFTVAGTPFRCHLTAMLGTRFTEPPSKDRAELEDRRGLMVDPSTDLTGEMELEIANERFAREGPLDKVFGITGEVEYIRCRLVRVT
jgi:hypothetical protein